MNIINYIPYIKENQPFKVDSVGIDSENRYIIYEIISDMNTSSVSCPVCSGKVHVYDNYTKSIRDVITHVGMINILRVRIHRYKCLECSHTFSEQPEFIYPGTRITKALAAMVKELLLRDSTITAVSELTGLHWNTVCGIHKHYIENIIDGMERHMKLTDYRPKYLAVDEFAIHKGHTYATTVMDFETGEILWAGRGRAKEDFRKFFMYVKEHNSGLLSEVEAFAMDMNASYNRLVEEYLPDVDIVYDRYHIQAQFGKDVLGSVRIESNVSTIRPVEISEGLFFCEGQLKQIITGLLSFTDEFPQTEQQAAC